MHHRISRFIPGLVATLAFGPALAADPPQNPVAAALAAGKGVSGMVVADGWKVTDLARGAGNPAETGAWVRFHYQTWLYDAAAPEGKGEQVDDSVPSGEPFVFQLGKQRVIMAWEAGIVGMRAGGKRRLLTPPQLAFGDRGRTTKNGAKPIAPNTTLVFEIELIDFLPPLAKP
jgi:FKBP-type peptidyl-prolyl cis-trans isomerase